MEIVSFVEPPRAVHGSDGCLHNRGLICQPITIIPVHGHLFGGDERRSEPT